MDLGLLVVKWTTNNTIVTAGQEISIQAFLLCGSLVVELASTQSIEPLTVFTNHLKTCIFWEHLHT